MLGNTLLVWPTALDIGLLDRLQDHILPYRDDSCTCNIHLPKMSIEHRVGNTFGRVSSLDVMFVDGQIHHCS